MSLEADKVINIVNTPTITSEVSLAQPQKSISTPLNSEPLVAITEPGPSGSSGPFNIYASNSKKLPTVKPGRAMRSRKVTR